MSSFADLELSLALNSFRISNLSFVILARGVVLMGLNVFLSDVCIFLAEFPWIAMQVSSFVDSCPMIATWAMSDVAYCAAQIRFSAASVEARSIER